MNKRLKFRCWNCHREYSMTRPLTGEPTLIVACPYCEKEAIVDLNPYPTKTKTVFRSTDQPAEAEATDYDLPAVIATAPPKG